MLNLPISREGFLWAFSITSQINRVPLDTTLLLHKHQAPFTLGSFKLAAEQAGLKVRQKAVPNSQLGKLPFPCLVTLIPVVEAVSLAANGDPLIGRHVVREYQMAMLESVNERSVVLAEACSKATTIMTREAFEKRFAGEALIIMPLPAAQPRADETAVRQSRPKGANKTGTNWFVPHPGWLRAIFRSAR